MKNELDIFKKKRIEDVIYEVRGHQVMLDSDVAFFFKIEIKRLNEQMKRNQKRFPEDFCFQLNSKEFKNLRSQNATFRDSTFGRKFSPYFYTEHGIIALAGVIKSDVAAKMSVEIARKFVQMRRLIIENKDTVLAIARIQNRQITFEEETNKKFDEILAIINKDFVPKEVIFFAGQYFDAYEFIISIITTATKSLILIDPYCDTKAFMYLKNKKADVNVIICNNSSSKLTVEEINQFESQYGKIIIKQFNDIHDRFLIIDNEKCYSLGTSLNYAGKKMFAINKIEDKEIEAQKAKLKEIAL